MILGTDSRMLSQAGCDSEGVDRDGWNNIKKKKKIKKRETERKIEKKEKQNILVESLGTRKRRRRVQWTKDA
jgi:hypothetical protein